MLILGIGNPLRGDDGLGWVVAEQLARANEQDCAVQCVHQLTPELAQQLATADLAIFIDASCEGKPGDIHIRQVFPASQIGPVGMHHLTPEELMALTIALYGRCPLVVAVTITGADFSLSESLSPLVEREVSPVCELLPLLRRLLVENHLALVHISVEKSKQVP